MVVTVVSIGSRGSHIPAMTPRRLTLIAVNISLLEHCISDAFVFWGISCINFCGKSKLSYHFNVKLFALFWNGHAHGSDRTPCECKHNRFRTYPVYWFNYMCRPIFVLHHGLCESQLQNSSQICEIAEFWTVLEEVMASKFMFIFDVRIWIFKLS